MDYEIRRLRHDEWELLRDIRFAALADAPHAFFGTLDEETGFDERRWRGWMARSVFFLAWRDGSPAGIAGGFRQDGGWHVISMWVSPHARGSGLAGQLIDAVAGLARADGAAALTLWVTDGNDRARAFYRRAGFRSTGRRQPVRPETPERWEQEMILVLADHASAP